MPNLGSSKYHEIIDSLTAWNGYVVIHIIRQSYIYIGEGDKAKEEMIHGVRNGINYMTGIARKS